MRRLFVILISFVLLVSLTLPALAWSELPSTAENLSIPWTYRCVYYNQAFQVWFSRNSSPTASEFPDDPTHRVVSITPGIIFASNQLSSPYFIESATTYYIEYIVSGTSDIFSYNANAVVYNFVPSDKITTVFGDQWSTTVSQDNLVDPLNSANLVPIRQVARDVSTTVSAMSSDQWRVRFAFTTNVGVDELQLGAILLNSNGVFGANGETCKFTITSFEGWYDPNGDVFDLVVQQGLLNVNNNLEDIKGSVESFRQDVNDSLVGDSSDYTDNSGVADAASDLIYKEDEINDLIYTPVTMPDGTVINVDSNTLNNFKDYIYSTYDPIDYDSSAGSELAKIFETFMPYVGVVVFLNLMLGAVLAFLRGRANA